MGNLSADFRGVTWYRGSCKSKSIGVDVAILNAFMLVAALQSVFVDKYGKGKAATLAG